MNSYFGTIPEVCRPRAMPGLRSTLLGLAACSAAALSGPASALGRRPTARALQRPAVLWLRAGSSASMSAGAPDSKLAALRAEMARVGVGALVVPSGDAHLSEYVHPHYDRRAFVSGFTGSAGTALVTPDRALLWTDGRYFLQAEAELGAEWSLMRAGEPDVPTLHQCAARDAAAVGPLRVLAPAFPQSLAPTHQPHPTPPPQVGGGAPSRRHRRGHRPARLLGRRGTGARDGARRRRTAAQPNTDGGA